MSQLDQRTRIAVRAPEIPTSFTGSLAFPRLKNYQTPEEDEAYCDGCNKALAVRHAEWSYAYADAMIEIGNK